MFRLTVLLWADIFAYYVLWMMMVYLTDVWKLDYTHAASIVNIWKGSILVLPLAFVHIGEALLGNFCLLLLSSLSYMLGLGLLWMSTPPVLAKSQGNCREYRPECIGDEQKQLFYSSLALMAVGMAGQVTSYGPFVAQQIVRIFGNLVERTFNDFEQGGFRAFGCAWASSMVGGFSSFLIPLAGLLVVAFVKPWAIVFGISAIFGAFSFLVFLSGVCSYTYDGPPGSPLTIIYRVLFAASSKMFRRRPRNTSQLYERPELGENALLPHTKGLRCLDKAAIILPEPTLEQQKLNRWRLCRVTEVEITKIFVRSIPMWSTFILCGVVSSIGDTYFLEQAKNLSPKLGKAKVHIVILLFFHDIAKKFFVMIFMKIYSIFLIFASPGCQRYISPVGISVSMVVSVLCCITAAKVETRRLGVVASHGLIDKPDERIPMNIFWLLPQFLLLAAMNGLRELGVSLVFVDQAPSSMIMYLNYFSTGVYGAGVMGGALSVYIVERISQNVGGRSWFQSTLNKSRLDNYYWVLAVISAVNLVFFIVVSIFYRYNEPIIERVDEQDEGENELEVGVSCCC